MSATRSSKSNESRTQAATAARTSRATSDCEAGRAKLAPSPPNTKGNSLVPSVLETAAMTEAAAVLTSLYRPSAMAAVERTMSLKPSTQSSGAGM